MNSGCASKQMFAEISMGSCLRRLVLLCVVFLGLLVCSSSSWAVQSEAVQSEVAQAEAAQSNPVSTDEEQIRAELVELRERVVKAYEARDLDSLIKDLGSRVVITWQNADRNRGPEEFRAFYKKMMEGDNAIVVDVQTKFEIDGSAELYGEETAVVCGTIKDTFQLRDGKDFTLDSKWTSTLIKSEGEWKIVSYHVSANVFNNPILTVAKSYLITFAIVGALLGFVLGCLIMWFIIRSTQKHLAAELANE